MAIRQIFNEMKGMKVKEVPKHLKPYLTVSNLKSSIQRGLDNYHAKYIQTDSIQPLYHVCFGGMIFSYLVALPEERRHLEHAQHAGLASQPIEPPVVGCGGSLAEFAF
ncbi:hypothetical protein QVD17_02742 [Tagetes erecta]|uniref:Uncharacterized protein n=1 Tax=Tagetes erecta TaxID=13708 RepID=A0AAD8LC82_TARER|nr:hypothetical protein QVD17_02742 [Tagetes erecta]